MPANPLRQLPPDRFDYWAARHLLNRAGFGGTPTQVRALANLGLERAVEFILEFESIETEPVRADEFDRNIMRPLTGDEQMRLNQARRSGDELLLEQYRQERQARQRADRRQIAEIQKWWLTRMIESPRPLEEKMTLFWHGHFATGYRTIEDSYHMFMQNQLFRSHAVGNFKQLTHQIIRDPAMLRYLNNNQNRQRSPNENLARELMELFTLGEGNAYTERDIKEGARALTGYTYMDDRFIDMSSAGFRNQHDDGVKTILGRTGRFNGDDFVDIIFSQRYVSEFITYKLFRYFVNDEPGDPDQPGRQFVLALARRFRDREYDVKTLLRTMFLSEFFYDEANVASQIKSPIQLIVQSIRSLRTPVRRLSALLSAADLMGQNLMYPPSVKGWDGGRSWINTATLFVRQNLMVYLLTGQRPDAYGWESDGSMFDASHLIDHLRDERGDADVTEAVTYLLRFCLGRPAHESRVRTLVSFVEQHGGALNNQMLIALLSLITAMPEYQLC